MGIHLQHTISHCETEERARQNFTFEGRYMLLKSNEEYPCRTFEISSRSVVLVAPVAGTPGEKVVLYLNELGRLAGVILQRTEAGFEMSLQLTPKKRERLASQLAWYAERSTSGAKERRRHDRVVPLMELSVLRLIHGEEHIVRIKSLSLSGVALETDHIIPFGAEVLVGNTPAKVVRILDDGVACEFVRHFRPGEIDETTRL
jgi:hypothetical protein